MIFRTRAGGNREFRFANAQDFIPRPGSGQTAWSGVRVNPDDALGLSAVGRAIRLVAETTGRLPLRVYRGRGADKRTAEDSWQWRLLVEQPCGVDCSAFDFRADVAASLEAHGNAFVHKVKQRRQVLALILLDPARMQVKREEDGTKVYKYWKGRETVTLPPEDLLHVRGFTVSGGDVGLNPIQQYRHELGNAIAIDHFQGDFFRNGATPGGALSVAGMNKQQAEELLEFWKAQHQGDGKAHRPAVLYGGSTWQQYGISLRDAQFVEGVRATVEDIARMWGVPKSFLELGEHATTEEDSLRLLNFALAPRLARIESAFFVDLDLFPPGSDVYPEFFVDDFLRADAATRAEVQHKQVQVGIKLVDEIRAEMGLPPLPDGAGQIPQITPVGGAPNPAPTSEEDVRERIVINAGNYDPDQIDRLLAESAALREQNAALARALNDQTEQRVRDAKERAQTEAERPVVVNVPEQRQPEPPVVNVNVEPTPIVNQVTVEQSDRRVRFKRDQQGRLSEATVEDER